MSKIASLLFSSQVGAAPPTPPGEPQDVEFFTYSGTKKGLTWTDLPADVDASHDVSIDSGATVADIIGPGLTSWASGITDQTLLRVRHNRNGLVSAFVGIS